MSDSDEFLERLQEGASQVGVRLVPSEVSHLHQYYALLTRWNGAINLTGLPLGGVPPSSLNRLIIEPLAATHVMPSEASLRWLDVGSGGGSPAVPMKIVRPQAVLTMVEPRSKRAAFLREVVRTLELSDAVVATSRVEELAVPAEARFQLVTVRALRLDESVLAAVRRLLSGDGRLACFGSLAPLALPGFAEQHESRVTLSAQSVLYVYRSA